MFPPPSLRVITSPAEAIKSDDRTEGKGEGEDSAQEEKLIVAHRAAEYLIAPWGRVILEIPEENPPILILISIFIILQFHSRKDHAECKWARPPNSRHKKKLSGRFTNIHILVKQTIDTMTIREIQRRDR